MKNESLLPVLSVETKAKRGFYLHPELIIAIQNALLIGASRTLVCKLAKMPRNTFDKFITIGERLWEEWHDGRREYDMEEHRIMNFFDSVTSAEAKWLLKAQGAVNAGLINKEKLPQARFASALLERREPVEWGRKRLSEPEDLNKTTDSNPSGGSIPRMTRAEFEKRVIDLAEQRERVVSKRRDAS